jgi:alkanesulfonate monooxygenase SsuD/methylene tetrahydromethanopterin reductase-like flavin-dependent oxidoreductase (luciferase family)
MRVGVGLPSSVPGIDADRLIGWAQRSEELEFSSVGVVDRIAYDCLEPMCLLANVAAATERIGLATVVLIAPLRNPAVLAKEAATIQSISGGRLTLGVGVGARTSDYDAAGADHRGRGERLTDQLADTHPLGEVSDGAGSRPTILVGGTNDLAFRRMANHSDGYVHGGGPPRAFERAAMTARVAWADAARPGRPLLWAQGYFALGADADAGYSYMRDYYAFAGPFAQRIAEGLLTTPQDVVQFVRGYSEAGCDELILMPASPHVDQLDRLAEILGSVR